MTARAKGTRRNSRANEGRKHKKNTTRRSAANKRDHYTAELRTDKAKAKAKAAKDKAKAKATRDRDRARAVKLPSPYGAMALALLPAALSNCTDLAWSVTWLPT